MPFKEKKDLKKPLIHTKNEIEGQPDLWIETINLISKDIPLRDFLSSVYTKKDLNIVLTGAGSSSFIGESITHLFRNSHGRNAQAIPTTTLVTHFEDYIDTNSPLLLLSFARSGNSPESIAVIDLAEAQCNEVYHIALTCNRSGQLAKKIEGMNNGHKMVLPSASEDRGLAMTGSFTSMMLSAIYFAKHENRQNITSTISSIAENTRNLISTYGPFLKELSLSDFKRIVFLGSGPLLGIARESHLKVQELTDGEVVGKFDSFLGFRHGPKAVVNNETVLVFLFSPNQNVYRYEKDLVEEILQEGTAMRCIGVFYNKEQAEGLQLDLNIILRQEANSESIDFDLLPYVIPAQIIGFYKSLDLGLMPDNPSKNNSISRVVKGVTIYQNQ